MTAPDTATRPLPPVAPVPPDVEQAEAAIVEHYPRLVRLAYLVLPPTLGRNRRVLTAHSLVQRALPRGRRDAAAGAAAVQGGVPGQRGGPEDSGYAYVRLRVLRAALEAGLPLTFRALPRRAQLPPALPQVWGLRLFPRSGGAEELALDQWLATLDGPCCGPWSGCPSRRCSGCSTRPVSRTRPRRSGSPGIRRTTRCSPPPSSTRACSRPGPPTCCGADA